MTTFYLDLAAAFTAGILGSLHCIGMCGPMAAFGCRSNLVNNQSGGPLLFVSGKFLSYSILGLVTGLLGSLLIQSAFFGKATATISVIGGFCMIVAIAWPRLKWSNQINFFAFIARGVGKFSFKTGSYTSFWLGVSAALLPCGLLYAMIARSAAAGNPLQSMELMQAFGLGTTPALLGMGTLIKYLPQNWKRFAPITSDIIIVVTGLVLIWRGAMGYMADPTVGPDCCCH